jgi:3',5'-cyclic-nucleotide phosphodiesterase
MPPDSVISVKNTEMEVTAYPLSHSNLVSTAFLIRHEGAAILYLGDTGADEIEKSSNLHLLWQTVAPLIKSHQLKAIMIEVSFPDEQPDKTLFGHLTPKWLMKEMQNLARLAGAENLKGFNIVVTHVKPPQLNIDKLKSELREENNLQLNLIFPEQGKILEL